MIETKAARLTTSGASRILEVTPDRVRQLVREGRLAAERTESGYRIYNRADVERLAEERAQRRSR